MTTTLNAAELNQCLSKGERLQLIDVRSAQEFATGHIPSAVNLPMEELEARLEDLTAHAPVVLVCQSGNRASMCAERLKPRRGDIRILDGGTGAWVSAGLPVVRTASSSLPLVRQVHMIVGPMVLASALLAVLVNPAWIVVTLLMGSGLTVAGTTGWCGMGLLLAKMPWNSAKAPTDDSAAACCN